MQLIRPTKQEVWSWPGVVNTILGGMSAGFYLLSSFVTVLQSGTLGLSRPSGFLLLAPILAGLGFLTLTVEAGHPLRGRHLLRRLSRSWMSRETLAGVIFIFAAAFDWLFPHLALRALAAAAAVGLMVSQGFIFYRVQAMPAWNVPLVPLLFLTSGFATGSGLMLLVALGESVPEVGRAGIGLIWSVLDLAVWLLYLCWPQGVAFREVTRVLRSSRSLVFTVGIGHALPILLLSLSLVAPGVGGWVGLGNIAAALAGLTIIVGGASEKFGILLKAGYVRGITLGRPTSEAQSASLVGSVSHSQERAR